jgi:hypothetical protein
MDDAVTQLAAMDIPELLVFRDKLQMTGSLSRLSNVSRTKSLINYIITSDITIKIHAIDPAMGKSTAAIPYVGHRQCTKLSADY